MMFDVVVDVMREQKPHQPSRPQIGARRGQGRAGVGDRAMFEDRAQAQNRLQHGNQRQHPQHQILHPIAAGDGRRQRRQMPGDHPPTVMTGGPAQRRRGIVKGPVGGRRVIVDDRRAKKIFVRLPRRQPGHILDQLAEQIAFAARVTGNQRHIGVAPFE